MRIVPDPLDPAVVKWLGGIQPAWTLLDWDTFLALHRVPSPDQGPIRFAHDLNLEEINQSAFARNALIVLRAAAAAPGLKLTATGNLSRGVVADLCARTEWPGFDKEEYFSVSKVMNETDFTPLFFLRHVLVEARLLRRHKGYFRITPAGRGMLEEPARGSLQALLFATTFWHLDLGYFTSPLHETWPQFDIGVVLWSLSVAAHDWETRERLTRMCTVPINELFERTWDTASHCMEGQVLRLLVWFGMLEEREEPRKPGGLMSYSLYRKAPLFDRLLSFEVNPPVPRGPRH